MTNDQLFAVTDKPVVGLAATYTIGSDSYGGFIIAVSKTGHRCTFRNESGAIVREFTRRKLGEYMAIGSKYGYLSLGYAETKLDPGF